MFCHQPARAALVCVFALGLWGSALSGLAVGELATGTGFVVSKDGWILTNHHVVEGCSSILLGSLGSAKEIRSDPNNDLAVILTGGDDELVPLKFRQNTARLGEQVFAIGYPLQGLLADNVNATSGSVTALAGISNDARYIQMSAEVQPGNSGGPLLARDGSVVGVVSAKLNAVKSAAVIGDIPQNVNFSIRNEVVRLFLDARGIKYDLADTKAVIASPEDVIGEAIGSVVPITCVDTNEVIARSEPSPDSEDNPRGGLASAILYQQGPVGSDGVAWQGSASWWVVESRDREVSSVTAEIKVPATDAAIVLTFKENEDANLSASHLVELVIKGGRLDGRAVGIESIPALVIKPSEPARGRALGSSTVKVSDQLFWIALPMAQEHMAANRETVREGNWIDIPIVLEGGERALVTVEIESKAKAGILSLLR